jgi:hypothetical protein
MRTTPKILLPILTCFFAGCASEGVSVSTDYDHAAQFGKYKTYTLAPPKRGETMSPLGEATLRDALRAEMSRRGIAEAAGRKAELDVVRHAFIQEKVSVEQYTDWGYDHGSWPYARGNYGFWGGAPTTYTDVNQYGEGTLILDLVDARTRKLVFRGTGKGVVGGPQENAAKIREAVAKMFAAYPSGGGR